MNVPCPSSISWKSRLINSRGQILIVAQGGGCLPRERTVRPVALAIAFSANSGVEAYFLTCSLICSLVGRFALEIALSAISGVEAYWRTAASIIGLGTSTGASARGRKSSSVGADWSRNLPTRGVVLARRICSCCRLSLFKAACCEGVPALGSFRATTPGLR